MKRIIFATALTLVATAASAQIGGNGVIKSPSPLGYTAFVTPAPGTNVLNNTNVCRGWPFPSFNQPSNLVGGYAIVPDAQGNPHYLLSC